MLENLKIHLAKKKAEELGYGKEETYKLVKGFTSDEKWAIDIVVGDDEINKKLLYSGFCDYPERKY